MLLRHLHRPLLHSVTAAWRPAILPRTSFQHGDSRSSSTTTTNDEQQEDHQNESPSPAETKPKPSLFEQLFPEEFKRSQAKLKEAASDADVPRNSWVSQLFDIEPPRQVAVEDLQDEDALGLKAAGYSLPALRAKCMLILSAASKNLLESDFLRLGVQGKHVEGWVGGILKVIQARNPDTLEPKGHYFILFDTPEAALAYKDRLEHLWQLCKAHIPGAHHASLHSLRRHPLPLSEGLRQTPSGEDVAQLVRSFTLVAPTQRRHVALSRMGPARIAELHLEGGFVGQLAARAGSEFLVLVRLDGGRLALDTLRRAIEDDGVRRNLAWRITDLENGILPFGKSILKAQDRVQAQAPVQEDNSQGMQGGDGAGGGGYEASGNGNDGKGVATLVSEAEQGSEKYRQYPRFIIPFMDKEEAHRFVLNWHRRELKLQMGGGGKDQPSWEESRIVNATILW
ncbi:hypothetical protein GGR51DRAFT_550005 [Nemania sp. FL0031]|nr:hypothetical protein GGR51DRAFT_550005 [Nemania sp. FL0031]